MYTSLIDSMEVYTNADSTYFLALCDYRTDLIRFLYQKGQDDIKHLVDLPFHMFLLMQIHPV